MQNKIEQSFDGDNYSISNSPSRYVETIEQLTNELTEAYQKNNALTQQNKKIEALNKKPERKIEDRLERKSEKINYMGGYIKSFFKKWGGLTNGLIYDYFINLVDINKVKISIV